MHELIYGDAGKYCGKYRDEIRNKFKLIYLDPPYNTRRKRGARKNYSDTDNHWGNNMEVIIKNSYPTLRDDGFMVFSINQMELFRLKQIADQTFTPECFVGLFPVKIRHKDRQLMINATFHDVFEYLLIYRKNRQTRFECGEKKADLSKFIYEIRVAEAAVDRREAAGKRIELYTPGSYEIIKRSESNENCFRRYVIAGKLKTANWSGEWYENNLAGLGDDLLIRVYGLEQEGLGYRWFHTSNSKRKSGVYFQSQLNAGRPVLPANDIDFTDEVTNIYREGGPGCDYKDSKKPEALINYLLDICTKKEDFVLDMFGGSGTSAACCIKKSRRFVMIDNNQKAIAIIKNRLENIKNGLDLDGLRHEVNYVYKEEDL